MDDEHGTPLPIPTVDPVGIPRIPEGWEAGPRDRRARSGALVAAAWFGIAAMGTTVLSLGAYCLTSDGADARELVAATSSTASPAVAARGAACPIPSSTDSRGTLDMITERLASLTAPDVPPIDRRHPAVVETATFALG